MLGCDIDHKYETSQSNNEDIFEWKVKSFVAQSYMKLCPLTQSSGFDNMKRNSTRGIVYINT